MRTVVEQKTAYLHLSKRPFTVALMLDVSGSTQSQLSQIREAANTFVSRLRSNDRNDGDYLRWKN